jgi:hypothetical protein
LIRILIVALAFISLLSVSPAQALILTGLNVTLDCTNFTYTDFTYTFDRDTTGVGSETFYIEILDGMGTLIHRVPGAGVGTVPLGAYFEAGAANVPYNIANPASGPIVYRWVSPAGNGFAQQIVLPTTTTQACIFGGGTPGYASAPAGGSTLDFGAVVIGFPSALNVIVSENGTTNLTVNSYTVINNPTGDFSITAPGGAPFTINDGSGVTQTITVQCLPTGPGLRTATLRVTSNDPANATVDYPLQCTGVATGILVTPTTLTVSEPGTAGIFTVRLSTLPTGDVTVGLTSSDLTECTVPANVVVPVANWNTGVNVTVTAADDVLPDGTQLCIVQTGASASADPAYNGINPADVTVSVIDDETAPPTTPKTTTVSGPPAPPLPPCVLMNGQTSAIVRANVPANTLPNGTVFCQIINENGVYRRSPAEIGHQAVLNADVGQAVDVFGLHRSTGAPLMFFQAKVQICLLGSGRMMYLDATTSPRIPVLLASSAQGGYTCANIPNAGIVVLVGGSVPAASAVSGVETALAGCKVRTTYAVRLRSEANTTSAIIATLPYDLTLTAIARQSEWFRVIYLDGQGWVRSDYLSLNGNCGS